MIDDKPLLVGVGPVLVDFFVHCDVLPVDPDLPAPGGKLHASDGEHMERVMKRWVTGWSPQVQVGGPVLVALRQACSLGADVRFVGAIGDDELGGLIIEHLLVQGFDVAELDLQKGRRSGSAIVWIDRHGERSILFDAGSLDLVSPDKGLSVLTDDVDGVHIDSRQPDAARALATEAKRRGIRVHYDIDPWEPWTPELLRLVDVAQCSYRELLDSSPYEGSVEEIAKQVRSDFDVPLFVCTNSDKQFYAASVEGDDYSMTPFVVPSVDSTGAGDVFAGAFEMAVLDGASTETALRFAAAAGAVHTTRLTNHAVPSEAEIRALAGDA